jgi:hypothetical protein
MIEIPTIWYHWVIYDVMYNISCMLSKTQSGWKFLLCNTSLMRSLKPWTLHHLQFLVIHQDALALGESCTVLFAWRLQVSSVGKYIRYCIWYNIWYTMFGWKINQTIHGWKIPELLDKALQRIGWHCSRWAPSAAAISPQIIKIVMIGRPKVALISFRIESSEGDETPGQNLVPGPNLGNNLVNTAAVEVQALSPSRSCWLGGPKTP